MKRLFLPLTLMILFLSSCKEKEEFVYDYETDPEYTWGYSQFWGPYYSDYGITNNVVTLNLFTDTLDVDTTGNLIGHGQYLYLEDIFMTPNDTLLPEGTYKISESGEPFTIMPGEEVEENGDKFDVGAYVYFIEKNETYSTRKFVIDGNMKVYNVGDKTLMVFDFLLKDSTKLKGRFEEELPYFDYSQYNQGVEKKEVKGIISGSPLSRMIRNKPPKLQRVK
jgi:hypothetical protein